MAAKAASAYIYVMEEEIQSLRIVS